MTQDATCPICGSQKEFTICPDCGGEGFHDEVDQNGDREMCETCNGDGDFLVCPNVGEAGHGEKIAA